MFRVSAIYEPLVKFMMTLSLENQLYCNRKIIRRNSYNKYLAIYFGAGITSTVGVVSTVPDFFSNDILYFKIY